MFVGVLYLSLFCSALLGVHSSFAIIMKRKRKLVALLLLSDVSYYKWSVPLPHGAVGWSVVCDWWYFLIILTSSVLFDHINIVGAVILKLVSTSMVQLLSDYQLYVYLRGKQNILSARVVLFCSCIGNACTVYSVI